MFRQIRYQTGEIAEIASDMKKDLIPCLDVDNDYELDIVIERLSAFGIFKIDGIPYDRTARNRIREPEFEYRIAFCHGPVSSGLGASVGNIMFLDVYFEPDAERTYDPVSEM